MLTFIQSSRRSANVRIAALTLSLAALSACKDISSVTGPQAMKPVGEQAHLNGRSVFGVKLIDPWGKAMVLVPVTIRNHLGATVCGGRTGPSGEYSCNVANGPYAFEVHTGPGDLPDPMPDQLDIVSDMRLVRDTTNIVSVNLQEQIDDRKMSPMTFAVRDQQDRPVDHAGIETLLSAQAYLNGIGIVTINYWPSASHTDQSGNVTLWTFEKAGALFFVRLTAPGMIDGSYTVSFNPNTVYVLTLNKDNINDAPIANAGGPYTSDEGSTITLDGTASRELDGEALTYQWEVNGQSYSGATVTVRLTDNGTYPVTLTVRDASNQSASATTTATVANIAPTINGLPPLNMYYAGESVGQVNITDPGADSWTVTIACGAVAPSPVDFAGKSFAARCISFPVAGWNWVQVTVRDDDGGSATTGVAVFVRTRVTGTMELTAAVRRAIAPPIADDLAGELQQALGAFNAGNVALGRSKLQVFSTKVLNYTVSFRIPINLGTELRSLAARIALATM